MANQVRDGYYLWQFKGLAGCAVEVVMNEAIVPMQMRICPPSELVGGGMTLTPLVAMTPERVAAIRYAAELLDYAAGADEADHLAALEEMLRDLLAELKVSDAA